MGQVVHAEVALHEPEDSAPLVERLRAFCLERFAKFKNPVRFTVSAGDKNISARFKKVRTASAEKVTDGKS